MFLPPTAQHKQLLDISHFVKLNCLNFFSLDHGCTYKKAFNSSFSPFRYIVCLFVSRSLCNQHIEVAAYVFYTSVNVNTQNILQNISLFFISFLQGQKRVQGNKQKAAKENMNLTLHLTCLEYSSQFTSRFAPIFFCQKNQSQTVIREKLYKAYEKISNMK
jgi:hypothetical protein